MVRFNLHLLSDSTGETLERAARAALAQFDDTGVVRHFWPMVRSQQHLNRFIKVIGANLGAPTIAMPDIVIDALENLLQLEAKGWPGKQHKLDEEYSARVDATHYTFAHDDGVGREDWVRADIVLAGVSRTPKTTTRTYLANHGYKVANIPIAVESLPPEALFGLRQPLVVGLATEADRLIQASGNRHLSLNQSPNTNYVDAERVSNEVKFARRMFAYNGLPAIDITRRSIEESAAAGSNLYNEDMTSGAAKAIGSKSI